MEKHACLVGLKPAEFWRLTFAEFKLIVDGFVETERRANYRAAMVVAAIYNVNRDPKKRKDPYTPEEILGEKKETATVETAKALTELYGGIVSDGAGE